VFTDFVELPSQLYEHWQEAAAVLCRNARHYQTGEPMPKDLLLKRCSPRANSTRALPHVEFIASALVDLDIPRFLMRSGLDVRANSNATRSTRSDAAGNRHAAPACRIFGHIFSGGGYAAGYYSYMWSEVLDADAFGAFEETGDPFDAATAKRLRDFIYSAGNLRDPIEAYTAFRGRLPAVDALLKKRGLSDAAA
jgi:peptidyl-dipeptidase Dcp